MMTRMLGWAMVPLIATLAGCGEPARDQDVTGGNQAIAESGAAAQVAQLIRAPRAPPSRDRSGRRFDRASKAGKRNATMTARI